MVCVRFFRHQVTSRSDFNEAITHFASRAAKKIRNLSETLLATLIGQNNKQL